MLLRSLTRIGVEIDLLAQHGPREVIDERRAIAELGVRSATGLRRRVGNDAGLRKLFRLLRSVVRDPRTPMTMVPYHNAKHRLIIENLFERGYSHVVFDGLHPAAVFSEHGKFVPPVNVPSIIYRAHNCETMIWDRAAQTAVSRSRKKLLEVQARKVRKFESSLIQGARGIAAISSEDQLALDALVTSPATRYEVVPIGFEPEPPLAFPVERNLRVLFLGRLDWPPNSEGLKWFLTEVWPVVAAKRSDIELVIAGSGDGQWLSQHLPMTRVIFLGRVPNVNDLYASCSAAIVPIFYGGGTRVKAIEAGVLGRACISTPLGVEGTGLVPGVEYLKATDAAEWQFALQNLNQTAAAAFGAAAHNAMLERFSSAAAAHRFIELLDATSNSKSNSRELSYAG